MDLDGKYHDRHYVFYGDVQPTRIFMENSPFILIPGDWVIVHRRVPSRQKSNCLHKHRDQVVCRDPRLARLTGIGEWVHIGHYVFIHIKPSVFYGFIHIHPVRSGPVCVECDKKYNGKNCRNVFTN